MTDTHVTVMCAATLDGRLTPAAGESSRVFGEYIPSHFTEELLRLREEIDAIVVGSGTILADDSRLVPRSGRNVVRLVTDSSGRLDASYTVLADDRPTIVAVTEETPASFIEMVDGLPNKSTAVLGDTRVDPADTVDFLGELGVEHALLEGGGRLIYSFLDAQVIDEMRILYVPMFGGHEDAPSIAVGERSLFGACSLDVDRTEQLGSFFLVHGEVTYYPSPS